MKRMKAKKPIVSVSALRPVAAAFHAAAAQLSTLCEVESGSTGHRHLVEKFLALQLGWLKAKHARSLRTVVRSWKLQKELDGLRVKRIEAMKRNQQQKATR